MSNDYVVARVLNSTNHYETLGVTTDVSERDLKAAYRQLSLLLHPDKCTHKDGPAAFKKVAEAHTTLSDPISKRTYDLQQPSRESNLNTVPGQTAGYRATTQQRAPWMQESSAPQKPIWESAEDIAIREKKLAEMEVRRLEHELAASRQELFNERREEKERQKRRDSELTVQKRLAVEAKAEISKVRQPLEARIANEEARHARERAGDLARIAQLEEDVRGARAESAALREAMGRVRLEVHKYAGAEAAAAVAKAMEAAAAKAASAAAAGSSAGAGGSSGANGGGGGSGAMATTRSIEQDKHGNFVVVEKCTPIIGPAMPPPSAEGGLSDDLLSLLRRLELDQFADRFEEEEVLDVALLRSFGPDEFSPNMREIGLDDGQVLRLRAALAI